METNRRRKREHEPHPTPSHTSITSLSDDVLGDILLRLPSLASLARAALACARWRRLATSRDFLCRFRAAHPSPPLLGCFVSFVNSDHAASVAFHRAQICSDRDLAAPVRGGDFLLASLEDRRQWHIRDCRHGILLLASRNQFALFNPVSRCRINLSRPTQHKEFDSFYSLHSCFLPASGVDGAHLPFRVVSLEMQGWHTSSTPRVRAHVYSSETGEWHPHPLAPPSIRALESTQIFPNQSPYPSMHAAGRIYWKYEEGKFLLSLDIGSMEFSHVALPPVPELYRPQARYRYTIGDTEDGDCCLVCVVSVPPGCYGRTLQVWLRGEADGSWELQKEVLSLEYACKLHLSKVRQVCAVTAGVLVICMGDDSGRCRYMAFCLKNFIAGVVDAATVSSETDFITSFGLVTYPYFFAWPSSLSQLPLHRQA